TVRIMSIFYSPYSYVAYHLLRSFPTRRSSDLDVWLEADQQLEVGGGWRGQDQELDRACHVRRAGRRVVDRALARRRDPLGGLGRPAEYGRDPGALRLEGERAADRTEADDAEFGGAHVEETSRNGWR